MVRWVAYAAYLVGSAVFFWTALRRDSVALAVGSGLFVAGTALYLVEETRQRRRSRDGD